MGLGASGIEERTVGVAQESVFVDDNAVLFELFGGPTLDTLSRERIAWMVGVGFKCKMTRHVLYRQRVVPM